MGTGNLNRERPRDLVLVEPAVYKGPGGFHGGAAEEPREVRSLEFLPGDGGDSGPRPPSVRLAVAVQGPSGLSIEILRWRRGDRGLCCGRRLRLPEDGGPGLLHKMLPVPFGWGGLVVVGDKGLSVIDWEADAGGRPPSPGTGEPEPGAGRPGPAPVAAAEPRAYACIGLPPAQGGGGAVDPLAPEQQGLGGRELMTGACWVPADRPPAEGDPPHASLLLVSRSGSLYRLDLAGRSPPSEDGTRRPELEVTFSSSQYKAEDPARSVVALPGGGALVLTEPGDVEVALPVPDPAGGEALQKVQTRRGLGPVFDLLSADLCGEGQPQVYVAAGPSGCGSLRVFRSSKRTDVLHESADEYPGLTDIWTLRTRASDRAHSLIVMSFVGSTRVLRSGWVLRDVSDLLGFISNERTVAVGLVADGIVAQVTRRTVRVCASDLDEPCDAMEGSVRGGSLKRSSSHKSMCLEALSSASSGSVAAAPMDWEPSRKPGACDPCDSEAASNRGREATAAESGRQAREPDGVWQPADASPISLAAVVSGYVLISTAQSRQLVLLGLCQAEGEDRSPARSSQPGEATPPGAAETRSRKRRKGQRLEQLHALDMAFELSCIGAASADDSSRSSVSDCVVVCGTYGHTVELVALSHQAPGPGARLVHLCSFPLGSPPPPPPLGETGVCAGAGEDGPLDSVPGSCHATFDGGRGALLILLGLRNGHLIQLQAAAEGSEEAAPSPWEALARALRVVAARRLGASPVSLVPSDEAPRSRVMALTDQAWAVWTSRVSLRADQAPLTLQPATAAAPLVLPLPDDEEPVGPAADTFLCYGADNRLRLVAVHGNDGMNCSAFRLRGTPRRIEYHPAAEKLLLTVARDSDQIMRSNPPPFEIACLSPADAAEAARHELPPGEVPNCLAVWSMLDPLGSADLPLVDKLAVGHDSPQRPERVPWRWRWPPARVSPKRQRPKGSRQLHTTPSWEQLLPRQALLRDRQDRRANPNASEMAHFVVVGTREHLADHPAGEHPCRGRLLLLSLHQGTESDTEEWHFSEVTHLKFMDPVTAVAVHPENLLVVAVGARLAAYRMTPLGRLQRVASLSCREPPAALSVCPYSGLIATGDGQNSVVTFCLRRELSRQTRDGSVMQEEEEREEDEEEDGVRYYFDVLHADALSASVLDCRVWPPAHGEPLTPDEEGPFRQTAELGDGAFAKQAVAAVDADGRFFTLRRARETAMPERNLTRATIHSLREVSARLTQLRGVDRPSGSSGTLLGAGLPRQAMPAGALMAGTLLGAVFAFLPLADWQYDALQAVERALARHRATQPLQSRNRADLQRPELTGGILTDPNGPASEPLPLEVLDGDLLAQLLELPEAMQAEVLSTVRLGARERELLERHDRDRGRTLASAGRAEPPAHRLLAGLVADALPSLL